MGLFESAKIWRTGGALLDNRLVATALHKTGALVNKLAAATMTPRLNAEIPWTPLAVPLDQARVSMVSTAGLHLEGDTPFDIDAKEGDVSFREIPSEVDGAYLRVSHTHYPHRYLNQDRNVVLPVDRLRELADGGVLRLARRLFSFGYSGTLTRQLIDPEDGTAHRLAAELQEDGVDLVLLAPA
jgi:D-proline reductase (dithiol) PrdB